MALVEQLSEVLPHPEIMIKNSPDLEGDSGVDNTSESGVSCDDDICKNFCFSSTESLDEKAPKCSQETEKQGDAKIKIDDKAESLQLSEQVTDSLFLSCNTAAILELEPSTVVHPLHSELNIDLDRLPTYFQDLWLGKQVGTDFNVPFNSKPSWFDADKFKRGQNFAKTHLFCINYAETLSLFLIFAVKSALEPLIFTQRSHTPFKAFQRYLSTLTRIMSWYEGDPWSEGSTSQRHMAAVRIMHRNVQNRLSTASNEELRERVNLAGKAPVWSTIQSLLQDDFRSACPIPPSGVCPLTSSGVYVNQFDMAVTQFAFVGLAVTYPDKFGIHYASDEDLEGFLHMWRALGHLLGIYDKYNFCNADLQTVRQRTYDFIEMALKPSLRDVTPDWEHMCRCLVRGIAFYVPGFSFDVSLQYLCNVLHLHTPRLTKSLSLWHSFMYKVVDITFNILCKIPGLLRLYNTLMLRAIRQAQDASPELLRKWEQREFSYMKTVEPVSLRSV